MNNSSTSEQLTFLKLINKHKIEIPIIQRDYAQGRDGKEELRKAFIEALYNAVNNQTPLELDFVYGSMKNDILQPLDGQQRLTTLFLLHWFVAVKENKLDDELKNILTKFSYETRTSSREFCIDLINNGIDFNNLLETDYHDKEKTKPKNNELSKTIIDSSWFFLSWKRDPTIKSMLTMLDAIQQTFQYETEVWDKLNNISFHYIELQNFGLSDDLYIKMNARGKPLTDFENFKAKFEQHIKKNNWEKDITNPQETFTHKIDTDWTDLFWNYRDKTENIFDEQLLNFFRTMAVINYALKANNNDKSFSDNVNLLRNNEQVISFNQYLDFGCFDEDYFRVVKHVLNKISDKSGLKTFLPDSPYINEVKIFKGVIRLVEKRENQDPIENSLAYADLVIAFAYYQYLALEENIETENLKNWMRIVRNLVEGSRPYLFNNANEFANALRSIKGLLPYRNYIIKHFSEVQIDSLSGFIYEQVKEEKLKAELIIQSDDWKNAIIEIENYGYFNGQIGFLLDWCKDEEGECNIDKFQEYVEKAKAIFSNDGLNNFDNYLFERALLAIGNYLLEKGRNYSFLINNERDISWKRLLRDSNNGKRSYLKQLVDNVSLLNLTNDLQKIIDEFYDKNDWRYYFVKQFEMIAACGSQKLIRKESEFDILLLGSTTTSGYHKEYYSYSLFIELKTQYKITDILYYPQKSVQHWKYFEMNKTEITFDCYSQNYVLLEYQDNAFKIKEKFKNREDITSTLEKLYKK